MANFKDAMDILKELEFNSPSNVLHKNRTESDITFYGIYRCSHPNWIGFIMIDQALERYDIKTASKVLYKNEDLIKHVYAFYKTEFWDKMRLDEINSQKIANEMFIFGVNAGVKQAVKLAQRIVAIRDDGIVGKNTIKALNDYDEDKFDKEYDALEIVYYRDIIAKYPNKRIFAKGWRYRAYFANSSYKNSSVSYT
ncbi:MAG: putative peptidoglycan-binding domain-containing protein [Campylobacter sputorum]|uniref:putative peptidoglycan-binding domain-containing protein n=1 Tax=Campylobacter sputorum TaxID=206 RepID=UPI002A918512|nr:putative peptidoglycan-binding domain-containing protein [Campylobacter sputorum]MDY6120121.1 putative peptidoglycan-binding domain-containing protein [Campylobacter sputorum]